MELIERNQNAFSFLDLAHTNRKFFSKRTKGSMQTYETPKEFPTMAAGVVSVMLGE